MNLFTKLKDFFSSKPATAPRERDFDAAAMNRLTADWIVSGNSADSENRYTLKTMRDRCRDLARNNDYARRYLGLVVNNVLGHAGVQTQMKIKEFARGKDGKQVERYDRLANSIIEDSFKLWGRKEFCTLSQQQSWLDVQIMSLVAAARDGAALVRFHYPKDHPHLFTIECIEIDQLDIDRNETNGDGSVTVMGIRKDSRGRVVSYYLLRNHPGELFQPRANGKWTEEVPANRILHITRPERVGESTGFPWLVSSILRLRHLGKFEEAAVVAARVGAAKMGFIVNTSQQSPAYSGESDSQGRKYMEAEPGNIEELPFGKDFKAFDPSYSSTSFGEFSKANLRGIAAGLKVSYTSLANDLESVNYSSIRAGLLEEREEWKSIQEWFIGALVRPVFEEWLKMAATAGALKNNVNGPALPASKLAKWNQVEFRARRWPWVDPLKDLQADVLAVEKGFVSRRQLIAERGGDIEDVFSDIKADKDLEDEYALNFATESEQQANVQQQKPDAPDSVDK